MAGQFAGYDVAGEINRAIALVEGGATAGADIVLTRSEFLILLALSGEPAHGYRIMQIINDVFAADTRIGPGTLYRALQRLNAHGCIFEQDEDDADNRDERRRSYHLTAAGSEAARREMRKLDSLVRLAKARLNAR